MPDSLSLFWGHSVHFAKLPIFQFLKLCSSPNFYPISSKLYTRYPNHRAVQAFGILAFWFFFLTQDHIHVEISKYYFSHNFHWIPSKFYENIGYHGKSKCLLEYRNQKLASST